MRLLISVAAVGALSPAIAPATAQSISSFTEGDVVVSVEGNGSNTGSYTDNQAAPLTLYEYGSNGSGFVGSFALPQSASGSNFAVSGEYGSSSEGTLQLSGNGRYLTIAGYGVNANVFNANPGAYSPDPTNKALGQSGSLTGQSYTAVPRVVALIGQNGSVNSSTALYNVFNANNPRSAYTVDGTSFYVSGQGNYPDATGGVFFATLGSHSATSITGADAGSGTSQDTREVQVYNGQLYVSTDSKKGSTNRDYVATLGAKGALPTGVANGGNGPAMLPGFGNSGGTGKITVTAATANNVNAGLIGKNETVNLSPENYFFANPDTLYVADSGAPKNTSARQSARRRRPAEVDLVQWSLDARLHAVGRSQPRREQRGGRIDRSLRPDRQGHHGRRRAGSRTVRDELHDWRHRPDLSLWPHRRAGRSQRASRRELRRA